MIRFCILGLEIALVVTVLMGLFVVFLLGAWTALGALIGWLT